MSSAHMHTVWNTLCVKGVKHLAKALRVGNETIKKKYSSNDISSVAFAQDLLLMLFFLLPIHKLSVNKIACTMCT